MEQQQTLKAAGAVLVAMAVLGIIDNYVTVIAEDAGLWQFHALRTAMALPALWVLAMLQRQSLRPERIGPVAVRSFLTGTGLLIYFGCLGFLSVSQAAAGVFTAPIFVLIFSVLFLKMRIGFWRIVAMAIGFSGVLLVLRPDMSTGSFTALIPVAAGALYALGMMVTRQKCAQENTLTLLAGFFLVLGIWGILGLFAVSFFPVADAPETAAFVTRGWGEITPRFLFWTFVQAIGSIFAVGLITWGYQKGETSYVAIFEYSLLIFAAIWGWLLWGQTVDTLGLIGIAMIIFSGSVIALRAR